MGVVVFACLAWLIIGAIRGNHPARRRWAWASGFAFVYLGLHSMLDSYANMPAVLLLVAVPVALLDATADRRLGMPPRLERVAGPLRSVALGSLIVVSVIAIVVLARGESTALTHQRAVYAANEADWREAYTPAARAVRDDPRVAPYQQTLGLAAAGVGAWHTAAGAFAAAAAIDDLPASWLGLAVAQLHVGEPAPMVAESLARALRLGTSSRPWLSLPPRSTTASACRLPRTMPSWKRCSGCPSSLRQAHGTASVSAASVSSDW